MIVIRSVCISAHLDSFCRRLDELIGLVFQYESGDPGAMRRKVGWRSTASYLTRKIKENLVVAKEEAMNAQYLFGMLREFDLFEQRCEQDKQSVYMSERWLKPLVIGRIRLPGIWRLFVPRYFRMVRRLVALMDSKGFLLLPCGIHAYCDFVRLYRFCHGYLLDFFREPQLNIVKRLGAYDPRFPRIRLWGYFVEASTCTKRQQRTSDGVLRILWVGRMLDWKCVDVLIRAFKTASRKRPMALQIVGEGPECKRLRKIAGGNGIEGLKWQKDKIAFVGYLPSTTVRELMQRADVSVMPSNAEEGWGAAVSEALSEGCPVISTYEAGSSATLLDDRSLYHVTEVAELSEKLVSFKGDCPAYTPCEWSGDYAGDLFLKIVREV